jgi:anti-anti-sigma factor
VDDGTPADLDERRVIAEREVMLELQRAMLPDGLPVLPEVSIAAEYAPADSPLSLGGDWFDVVPMPGDRVGLVVGDAVGHGPAAVAVMGQLRAVAAEWLRQGSGLDEVITALDGCAAGLSGARGCAMCLAVLDRRSGAVRYAVRGHPPPLVVGVDGSTTFRTEATGPPLALARNRYTLGGAGLAPGETLVLYSDGVVERPGRTFGQGLAELALCTGAVVRRGTTGERGRPGEICAAVTRELAGPGSRHDDVSVVAATMLTGRPQAMTMTETAVATCLGPVRGVFSAWLRGFQPAEDDLVALELSLVEAVTNSIEHAFTGPPGEVRVDAELDGAGSVNVVVTDNGRWKPPRVDPGFRGRGLVMMREFSDDLMLRTSEEGTTVRIVKALHRPVSLDGMTRARPRRPERTDFRMDVKVEPERVVVSLAGAIDSSCVDRLHAGLLDATRRDILPLVVVLDEVTLLASAGLRTLYEHAGNVLSARRSIRLVVADSNPARDVLAVSGLDRLVEVAPQLG